MYLPGLCLILSLFVVPTQAYDCTELCGLKSCAACQDFDGWLKSNPRDYAEHASLHEEYRYRREVWNRNRELVLRHNSEGRSYSMSLNRFADLTFEEFSARRLMPRQKSDRVSSLPADPETFKPINWHINGFVPQVLDQGDCGSCWAFSAAETMSAHLAYTTGQPVTTLSPQELVDCVPNSFNCFGCAGGYPSRAMEYALAHLQGGLVRYPNYPYVGQNGQCNTSILNQTVNVGAASVYNLTAGSQRELLYILSTTGPISVALDATMNFQFYKSGVFDDTSCTTTDLNHALLLYGLYYDPLSQRWAYMVRNSWGLDADGNDNGWGDQGDIFLDAQAMNGNICGISSMASTLRSTTPNHLHPMGRQAERATVRS